MEPAIIKTVAEMQAQAEAWRREGKQIALVPTMGYLHDGHLELMRQGRKLADLVVVSIFVNPTQFGPGEDLARYPRDLPRDVKLCQSVGVECIFNPAPEEVYQDGYQTYINVERVTQNLCGRSRPGHFRGVATVVAKLFNMVKPHFALFGEKDFQQLAVIKRMARDLNMDLVIVPVPTVREPDGLAMSSRNTYLNPEERSQALVLRRGLDRAQELYAAKERSAQRIIAEVAAMINAVPSAAIDYVSLVDADTLEDLETIQGPAVMALAVKIGKTRLIDNHRFHD